MKAEIVLAIPMAQNDASASTIKDYLKALLSQLWDEEEGFSGKRPFGNSGWKYEVFNALVKAGAVDGSIHAYSSKHESYEEIECADEDRANKLIMDAIASL